MRCSGFVFLQAGEGGANAKALSMMDEELDEVKALKMRLNLMKVQRIREKQITEVKEQREDEDDLQMVGADINMTCPITMSMYQATGGMAPLKSKTCGHTYSKDGVAML